MSAPAITAAELAVWSALLKAVGEVAEYATDAAVDRMEKRAKAARKALVPGPRDPHTLRLFLDLTTMAKDWGGFSSTQRVIRHAELIMLAATCAEIVTKAAADKAEAETRPARPYYIDPDE